MSRIDDELKLALRREEPSRGFTDRVMERINTLPLAAGPEKSREKIFWWRRLLEFFQPLQIKWAMAVALVLTMAFAAVGVYRYREHERRMAEIAEGEKAKEQIVLAMKIASSKLNLAQKKVQESGQR